jgi:hypothetical protein
MIVRNLCVGFLLGSAAVALVASSGKAHASARFAVTHEIAATSAGR